MKRTNPDSFLKIVVYTSAAYEDLNLSKPTYRGKNVKVLNVEKIAEDNGTPLFCYELVFVN